MFTEFLHLNLELFFLFKESELVSLVVSSDYLLGFHISPYRAEGFHTHGSVYSEKILNVLQCCAERCDQLHGFLCLFSLGGGTGSGLGSAVLNILEDNFPLVERYEWNLLMFWFLVI
jgi:hypothetical protein